MFFCNIILQFLYCHFESNASKLNKNTFSPPPPQNMYINIFEIYFKYQNMY